MRSMFVAGMSALALLAACSSADDGAVPPTDTAAVATAAPSSAASTSAPTPVTTATPTTGAPTTVPTTTPDQPVAFSLTQTQDHDGIGTYEHPDLVGTGGWLWLRHDATGDITGPITSVSLILDDGTVPGAPGGEVGLMWFEGTVTGCGTGGAALRTGTRPDGAMGWEIVPGLGTGELASLSGSGTQPQWPDPAWNFTGTVRCDGGADPTAFSTTLLASPAAAGVEASVPAHVLVRQIEHPIDPHPAHTVAPRIWVAEVEEDLWTSPMLFLEAQPGTTGLRNTMVSFVVTDIACGTPSVVRVFIDDVVLAQFRGAWDVNAILNSGRSGGGVFDATTNSGRVGCG